MNIQLQPKHLEFIQTQIESGRYNSFEDVISEAFKALEERDRNTALEQDRNYQKWLDETGQKIDIAREELKRGEILDGEEFVAQLQEKLKQARHKQA